MGLYLGMLNPHFDRRIGVAALALTSTVIIAGLQAGAEISKKANRPAAAAPAVDAIAALSHFDLFTPQLPIDLPAHFEVAIRVGAELEVAVLDKHSVRGDGFKVLVDNGNGSLIEVAAPEIRTYKGTLVGRPGTTVTGSLLTSGLSAAVQLEDGTSTFVQPLSDFRAELPGMGQHVAYSGADAIPDGQGCALGRPGFPMAKYRSELSAAIASGQSQNEGGIAGTTPSQVELACETDYEFFQKNGSNVAATLTDVELIVSNVNTIYDRDVNIIFELGTVVIRSDAADPYTTTTIDGRLTEFGNKWSTTPESGIYRDISHMFSGYNFSGGTIGLAYLGGVCTGITSAQYGVVESRYTTTLGYRISLSAHELGHNWDATHCDSQGTAACHIMCSSNGGCGGISGSNLKLDPLSISEMTTYLGQIACDFARPTPATVPFTEPFAASLATAKWTYNDGGVISQAATGEPTAPYSLLLNSTGTAAYDDDEVRTNYILLGGTASATAAYKVERTGVESGEQLYVEYLNSSLDWVALNTLTSDGTAQTAFTSYEHSIPSNGRHDKFRLRFRTDGNDTGDNWYIDDVNVYVVQTPPPPANDDCSAAVVVGLGTTSFDSTWATDSATTIPAICTANGSGTIFNDVWFKYAATCTGATTVSTCGLANFDTRVVAYVASSNCPSQSSAVGGCNDDGAGCTSGTSSATFNAIAGNTYHIRVGGATGGGVGSIAISCVVACPPDVNGDLYVDAGDLTVLLSNWGGAGSGDVNNSGTVDAGDLAVVLAGWGACP